MLLLVTLICQPYSMVATGKMIGSLRFLTDGIIVGIFKRQNISKSEPAAKEKNRATFSYRTTRQTNCPRERAKRGLFSTSFQQQLAVNNKFHLH